MSNNDMAIILLNVGPSAIVVLMFIWGIILLQKKPNEDEIPTGKKVGGWFLILASLAILALWLSTFYKPKQISSSSSSSSSSAYKPL